MLHYERNHSLKTTYYRFHLYQIPTLDKSIETESRLVVA